MNILNIINAPWAILPENFNDIHGVIEAHLRGPKLNLKDLETRVLSSQPVIPEKYEIRNESAVIPIKGPLAKNPDIFDRVVLGLSSMTEIKDQFLTALSDPNIKKIILWIDSPGSTVDGTQELARIIYDSRGIKTVFAFSDGCIASGAYWIGAAADKIYISGDTINAGSIGVRQVLMEISKADAMAGITVNELIAGKYKNAGSSNIQLSDNHREYLQAQVDYVYEVFLNDVSKFRGIDVNQALLMADGKIFIGQQAIEVGLVDGVSTLDELIDIGTGVIPGVVNRQSKKIEKLEAHMQITAEVLQKEHPEVYAAVIALGKVEAQNGFKSQLESEYARGKSDGMAEELKRVQDVNAQMLPGHEKLIMGMVFDGKSSAADAAQAIVRAENEKRSGVLNNLKNGQKSIGHAEPHQKIEGDPENFLSMVAAYQKENKCSKGRAMAACVKQYPELHTAYIDSVNQRGGV